jgi:dolichyl-phosphate beta-glucosyltransferase
MIDISVVIPAWNEAQRLPRYLDEVLAHLEEEGNRYEVIVVDDGGDDALADAIGRWLPRAELQLLRHATNQGKGASVATGIAAATGELVLFADADGATPISEERKLRQAIVRGADMAIGIRCVGAPQSGCTRRSLRRLTGALFQQAVRLWLGLPYRDTQCGFKMFRRPVAVHLFSLVCERRYLFDLELLCWAHRLGYRVDEIPIAWSEQPGSKLRVFRDGPLMLAGLERLRRRFTGCRALVTKTPQGKRAAPRKNRDRMTPTTPRATRTSRDHGTSPG